MQPLFWRADAQLKRVFSSLRSRIITRLRTGSGLFSSTTSGSSATPQPSATIDTIASAAHRGVNRRIADFMAAKPQLNAATHRALVGHDKRHRYQSGFSTETWLRTGQGSAGAISTTARFSSIENATAPGSVSGFPAIARSASRSPLSPSHRRHRRW
jgi:hypothetical protein